MRLRIRHADGVATLSDVSTEQTVLDLKENIIQAIGANQEIQISGGFPPKPITDNYGTLGQVGIRDGDVLNIKLLDTPFQKQTQQQPEQNVQSSGRGENDGGAIETDYGLLIVRISCYVLNRDRSISAELRKVVAEEIRNDSNNYSNVTLGQPRDKYIEWIQKQNSWGGAIELAILSSYFNVEIDSIDVQTGRIDKFGEGSYDERVLIVYSGIHYDAMAVVPELNCPTDFDQTRFPANDDSILTAAKKLVDDLRKKHKYTDVANFSLKCQQCDTGLVGEKEAQDHAESTGHTHFLEY